MNGERWEFVAMPWTWQVDVPQTLSDGWEPIGTAVVGQMDDVPTLCLIARRRIDAPDD